MHRFFFWKRKMNCTFESLPITNRVSMRLMFVRLLLCIITILMGINCQLFAEVRELSTYAHLIKVESQNHKVHSHHHSNSHSHKHQHSKDEPEHEHTHSDGAIFGTSSVAHALLPQGFFGLTIAFSDKISFHMSDDFLPEGLSSSNFRPPIA